MAAGRAGGASGGLDVRRLTSRPELLFVLALIALVALLPEHLPLGIAGLGVVSGCLLGLHAMGIALLYSRSSILSFAQFGLGGAAAVLFYLWVYYNQWAVLAEGLCRCLAPDGSGLGDLQHNPDGFREVLGATHPWVLVLNAVLSAALGLLLAADTGRRVFLAVAGLFARAPRIVPTVATLAFAIALGGAPGLLSTRLQSPFGYHIFSWFPYGPRPGTGEDGTPAIPEGTFHAPGQDAWAFTLPGGARFHLYDVLVVVVALSALALLVVRFRLGRRGLASRATASNVERAATLGVDVITESTQPWVVAGVLSGMAGILSVTLAANVPNTGLDTATLTIVLGAVVLARMTSPGWALGAAVLLSVLDQGMFWNFGSRSQFQGSLVVIIGIALLLQRGRVSRAEQQAQSAFTTSPEPVAVPARWRRAPGVNGVLRGAFVLTGLFFAGYPLIASPRQLSLGIGVVAYAVLAMSLLVLSGWAGQVSLGQLALGAVSGYLVVFAGQSWHLPLPLALVLGALASALVSPWSGCLLYACQDRSSRS